MAAAAPLERPYRNPVAKETPLTDDEAAAQKTLRGWLHRRMRVVLPDGRVMVGAVVCVDGCGNLVLERVTETRRKTITNTAGESRPHMEEHSHSFVIVPGDKIESVQLAPEDRSQKLLEELRAKAGQDLSDLAVSGTAMRGTQVPPLAPSAPALD